MNRTGPGKGPRTKKAMLIEKECSSPLSQLIVKEYNKLATALSKVSLERRGEKILDGKASASDLIAYQIGWGKLLIGWYEAGEKKKKPQMPGEGFTKWDYTGLAKHFYQKYAFDSGKKQEMEFYKVVNTILEFVEKEYAKGQLDQAGIWEWCTLPSGKEWPLSKWVKVNTSSPYAAATKLIKKI